MKITFDSNAWERIFKEENGAHPLIRKIENGEITPYICEIAISLESIQKKSRKDFMENYAAKVDFEDVSSKNGTIHQRVLFSPNNEVHPGLHPKLKKYLFAAYQLGFKILPMTRMGTVRSPEIYSEMHIDFQSTAEFWSYAERLKECSDFIESLGCGFCKYEQIKDSLNHGEWSVLKIKEHIPEESSKSFHESIAEWVDGDILSAHYAIGNDIFCTEDRGNNAGTKSIMHPKNLEKLKEKYKIKILTLDELQSL